MLAAGEAKPPDAPRRKFRLALWGLPFLLILVLLGFYYQGGRQRRLDEALLMACYYSDTQAGLDALAAGANPSASTRKSQMTSGSSHSFLGGIVSFLRPQNPEDSITRATSGYKRSALYFALMQRNSVLIRALLERGADVNVRGNHGTPLFMEALGSLYTAEDKAEVIEIMLKHGAEVNARNDSGNTALGMAAYSKNHRIFQRLLKAGADISTNRDAAVTLLNLVASQGSDEEVLLLLNKGLDVNSMDKSGRTPLSYAVSFKRISTVSLLLSRGANPNLKSNLGRTPLEDAISSKNEELIKLCRKAGGKPRAPSVE